MSQDGEALRARAEVAKLARLLGRDPGELGYLDGVSVEDLRELREQVTETLFNSQAAVYGKLAAASRLLPTALVAALAERSFGPVLSARIAGRLEPGRAVDVAARLTPTFLADVAVELDPRRASEVVARVPPEQIAAVTRELARRHEHVAMGRYVGHLGDDALRAALAEMDDETVIEVSFVLEEQERVEDVVRLLPPARRAALGPLR